VHLNPCLHIALAVIPLPPYCCWGGIYHGPDPDRDRDRDHGPDPDRDRDRDHDHDRDPDHDPDPDILLPVFKIAIMTIFV